ncbi:SDR family NAD(P)-dependent oxidoreductase [Candidatus Protofrankia californiensis]|uniref:SDR family NAD(P)-dependent oxidoreductase n=1 Tax=Candidatus Protofrankia californiensis TaxID=1839754 RepID=UPI001041751F|nr:SDR family NAD(P)-dependent oxidoreductase [Candidatus Protofrankia californiensis]
MSGSREVALVTGAGRGIGAATARELGRRGYHVVVNFRSNVDAARAVALDVEAAGATAQCVQADVCDPDQVERMVDAVLADQGRIDVLVCNANTVAPPFAPLASLAWKDFINKVSGELAGAFFVTQQVLAAMRGHGGGRIVYVSSTAADYVGSNRLSHSTAKSALNTFSRHVAAEAASYGITVNTIAPGSVRTEASAPIFTPEREKHLETHSVLQRVLEPEDIAAVIGQTVDAGMRSVTGALIRIDAGFGVLVGGPSSTA